MIDYHIHTSLCNHATGIMEAYVKKAVDIGLKEICFLDHLIISKNSHAESMTPKEVPLYFQAVQQLKHRYKEIIKIKVGLEVDFIPENVSHIQNIIETFSFDVIGSSVHFLGDWNIVSRRLAEEHNKSDVDDLYNRYFEQIDYMLDFNYFDVVCHLDVVKKFGNKPSKLFEKKINEILSKISYKDIAVELNTNGYNHPAKTTYPGFHLLKKCHDKNIDITIGSDAHHPESVGQHYGKALPLIFSAGYRHVAAYTKRRRYTISLSDL